MEQEKYEGFSALTETAGARLRAECVGEYTLPDYRPEIRRVLGVCTRLLPSGQYGSGGRTEMAGICAHTLLCSTAEGDLTSVELSTEYCFSFPASEGAMLSSLPPFVESDSVRLLGPRKVSLRTVLCMTPHVAVETTAGEELAALLPDPDVMTLTRPTRVRRAVPLAPLEESFSVTVPVEEGEVLLTRGTVAVRETSLSRSGMLCRGALYLTALLSSDGGIARSVMKEIPFEVTLPTETELTGASMGWGSLHACSASVAEGESGRSLTLDATVSFEGEVVEEETVHPIIDLFSTKSPLCARSDSVPYTDYQTPMTVFVRAEGSVSRSESDSEEACAVIDTFPEARVTDWAWDGGKLTVKGECRMGMALAESPLDAEGRLTYSAASFPIPFEVSLSMEEPCESEPELLVQPLFSEGRIDPGSLSAEVELAVLCRPTRTVSAEMTVAAEASGDPLRGTLRAGEVVSVYLTESDSLWSVAKRYGISPTALAETNGITSDPESMALPVSLDGCVRLLVGDV